jgi:hypothetical protein
VATCVELASVAEDGKQRELAMIDNDKRRQTMAENSLAQLERLHNGVCIVQRGDGYWNATAMCKANEKMWADYWRSKTAQEYATELSSVMGIPTTELVQVRQGGNPELQGTWVHQRIALHLAQWCNARFAVLVTGWIEELLAKGRVELHAPANDLTAMKEVLDVLDRVGKVFSLGRDGMENRDAILLKDLLRNRLVVEARTLAGTTCFITLPERCQALGYGLPKRGIDSELGKCVAQEYRRVHGRNPPKHQQFVDGRTVQVNSYTTADLDVVDAGIHAYFRLRIEGEVRA